MLQGGQGGARMTTGREAVRSSAGQEQDHLSYAREVLRIEAQALLTVAERLGPSFTEAVQLILGCPGSVIVTGMGKAGLVGQKIAATFASTGTKAHPVHPAEAVHGDLGRIGPEDVVLALSYSGETEEVLRLLEPIRRIGSKLIALTGRAGSRLAAAADVAIVLGQLPEACPLGLAPSTSSTAMMAVGDALAFAVSRARRFAPEQFAIYHPAGALGRLSAPVDRLMRTGDAMRIARMGRTVREALIEAHRPGRRTGAVLIVDASGRLRGIFTDGDLVRLLGQERSDPLQRPIEEVMTKQPATIRSGATVREAIQILARGKYSQLPVLDAHDRPIGILDVTDIVSLLPDELRDAPWAQAA
jgi:arabinose-5-phosphate isomerase